MTPHAAWLEASPAALSELPRFPRLIDAFEDVIWYAWQDSNLRPVAPEATALSI